MGWISFVHERDTLVRREFKDFLTLADEEFIRDTFKDAEVKPDDDINTSVDQTTSLIAAIQRERNPLRYPDPIDGKFVYDDVLAFLDVRAEVFKWEEYEAGTLGKPSLRRWYAVIFCQWMDGTSFFENICCTKIDPALLFFEHVITGIRSRMSFYV